MKKVLCACLAMLVLLCGAAGGIGCAEIAFSAKNPEHRFVLSEGGLFVVVRMLHDDTISK